MQISIPILHTLWRYNRRTMKLLLPISIASRQQLSNVLLIMILQESASLLRDFEMHPTSQLKFMKKDTKTLAEVIGLVEKLNAVHQLTATLTPSTVSMMSSNHRCFICGCTGHFGHHFPDGQCYGCDEFGHLLQDCPNKIPPSGTPCHQDRSCLRHQYTHNQRDRSHSYYGPRHWTHFSRSQSCCHSHHIRSSSFRRHIPCSSSNHPQWLTLPFSQWMPPSPLMQWHQQT